MNSLPFKNRETQLVYMREYQKRKRSVSLTEISLDLIDPTPAPIRDIDGATINDLRESIKSVGVLQPILLRYKAETKRYEIVFGNHRFYAAKGAGLKKIPAQITKLPRPEALFLSVTENVQRLEMNPVKEGEALSELTKYWTIQRLSQKLGKSVTYIRGRVSLYENLAPELQDRVGGELTLSSAIAISKVPKNIQVKVFEQIERTKKRIENEATPKGLSYGGGYGNSGWSNFCICPKCGSRHEKGANYEKSVENNTKMS